MRATGELWKLMAMGASWGAFACAAEPPPRAMEAPALVETADEARASGAPEPSALEPPPATAEDTSLERAVYHAAGVPAVDHAWSVPEYQRCLEVFVDLVRTGRRDLPRAASVRSGALFARLVDARNFEAPAGTATDERARQLEGYLEVFPGFLKVYAPASDDLDFSLEQAELIVGLLELLKSALEGSRQQSAIDPSWEPVYERQKAVVLGVVRGAATMLGETERYSPAVRRHLRAHLARLEPELERHLDPEAAREVRAIAFESAPSADAR